MDFCMESMENVCPWGRVLSRLWAQMRACLESGEKSDRDWMVRDQADLQMQLFILCDELWIVSLHLLARFAVGLLELIMDRLAGCWN